MNLWREPKQQINWILKYNIPISTDPKQVSKVKAKKTKSFEQRKTNVEQMNLETRQHLTWCNEAVRQKVSIHKNDGKLMKVFCRRKPQKVSKTFWKRKTILSCKWDRGLLKKAIVIKKTPRHKKIPCTFQRKETTVGDRRSNWNEAEWNEIRSTEQRFSEES